MKILIPAPVQAKLKEAVLSAEEARQTVAWCEETGNKILKGGGFAGHLQISKVTCWVEYTMDGEVATLTNVYAHRLQIKTD